MVSPRLDMALMCSAVGELDQRPQVLDDSGRGERGLRSRRPGSWAGCAGKSNINAEIQRLPGWSAVIQASDLPSAAVATDSHMDSSGTACASQALSSRTRGSGSAQANAQACTAPSSRACKSSRCGSASQRSVHAGVRRPLYPCRRARCAPDLGPTQTTGRWAPWIFESFPRQCQQPVRRPVAHFSAMEGLQNPAPDAQWVFERA